MPRDALNPPFDPKHDPKPKAAPTPKPAPVLEPTAQTEETLSPAAALEALSAALKAEYKITAQDAGLDETDAVRLMAGMDSPAEAAVAFGIKHNLTPADELQGWSPPKLR